MLGISKCGEIDLRTLLIQGARPLRYQADRTNREMVSAIAGGAARGAQRRNKNIATVALVNENSRISWAWRAVDNGYKQRQLAGAI